MEKVFRNVKHFLQYMITKNYGKMFYGFHHKNFNTFLPKKSAAEKHEIYHISPIVRLLKQFFAYFVKKYS